MKKEKVVYEFEIRQDEENYWRGSAYQFKFEITTDKCWTRWGCLLELKKKIRQHHKRQTSGRSGTMKVRV